MLALLSIDSTRAVIVNAKASLASVAPVQFGAAQQDGRLGAAAAAHRRASPRMPRPPSDRRLLAARHPDGTQPGALASASPSRDEITAAYQTAIKGRIVVVEPVAREAAREAAPVVPAIRETEPPPANRSGKAHRFG